MSFGVSRDGGRFEWAGSTVSGIFAQRANLLRPSFYHMLFDIIRFNYCSAEVLAWDVHHPRARESMDEYLTGEGYCAAFRNDYLVPMTAAVWSTGPTACAASFPIMTLVRFMWNHHLLNTLTARPDWLTIPGGSRRYVERIAGRLPKVKLRSPVRKVERGKDAVAITTDEGTHSYDHVIFASHADATLAMLDADREEQEVLGHFRFTVNTAILHSDERLMPQRRQAWTSWNYMDSSAAGGKQTCLTYWMNSLQHIPQKHGPVLVTLNPIFPPRHQQGQWTYTHPLYTPDSVDAQRDLQGLQGRRRSHICGAWTQYGFHEDAFSSGIRAAMDLGAKLPFAPTDAAYSRGRAPRRSLWGMLVQWLLMLVHLLVSPRSKTNIADGSKTNMTDGSKTKAI